MNRADKRRQKKKAKQERKRKRSADERLQLKRKTDWALQLTLGCTLMTLRDLYPEVSLDAQFFNRLNENIVMATVDSHDLEMLFKVIKDEYGFDIRKV